MRNTLLCAHLHSGHTVWNVNPGPDVEGELGETLSVEDAITRLNIQPLKLDGK